MDLQAYVLGISLGDWRGDPEHAPWFSDFRRKRMMPDRPIARGFWMVAGLFFTGCAFVGVVLPLIPTTPFLLLAAFCFARSSERFHTWLYEHKLFGPLLTNWSRHGAISRKAKLSAGICLALAPVLSFAIGAPLWTIGVQLPVLLCSGLFIFTRPDGPKPVLEASEKSEP